MLSIALDFCIDAFNEDFERACFQVWKVINFLKYADVVYKMYFR